jgi:hypothetical protein
MLRSLIRCGAVVAIAGLAACDLKVINPNAPETDRVLRSPENLEALLAGQWKRLWSGLYGSLSSIQGMVSVLSLENFSGLANNGMGAVISIPRPTLNNAVGNGFATEHRRVYYFASETARTSSIVLSRLSQPGFTLNPATPNPAQDRRARAFAEFVRGLSLGYIALFYDSGAVITPDLGTEDPGVLVGYQELMAEALNALQAAIDVAAQGIEPLPPDWMPSNVTWNAANFTRLIRSYRARLRANVARTPTERAAVDWDAVIADATNGITDDHFILMSTTVGPTESWRRQWVSSTTWHQMAPFYFGMGDVSGSYAAWVAAPLDQRGAAGPFFMVTPDQRFPQGATRAAQQADFNITNTGTTPATCVPDATRPVWRSLCKRYFRNRPTAEDAASGAAWGVSNYDHILTHPFHFFGRSRIDLAGSTGGNGYLVYMTKAEMDLLAAEGHYRKGNYAAAANLVNITRVQNAGLPAAPADATSPVPGGANCVPKKPVNAAISGGGTVVCGDLWEALKWEKRIETAYTHFGAWFLDSRGWGDLVENTGLHWAPPYEDYQARQRSAAIYSTGGGLSGSAARSGYGW